MVYMYASDSHHVVKDTPSQSNDAPPHRRGNRRSRSQQRRQQRWRSAGGCGCLVSRAAVS
jgi:hypothetical protein